MRDRLKLMIDGKPGKNIDLENYEGTKTKRLTCAKQNDVDSDVGVQRLEHLHGDPLSRPQRFSLHGLGCVQHDDDFLARRTGAGVELRIEDQHAGLEGETGGFNEITETGEWREAEAEEEVGGGWTWLILSGCFSTHILGRWAWERDTDSWKPSGSMTCPGSTLTTALQSVLCGKQNRE